jgi:hypothetical protein
MNFMPSRRPCAKPRLAPFLLLLGLITAQVSASASTREDEIAQCLPGEQRSWGDGVDRPAVASPLFFVYQHGGAPSWFTPAQVQNAILLAASAWSRCGVPARLISMSGGQAVPEGAVLVQWSDQGSMGNFGLANLSRRTLALGPAAFELLNSRNPGFPARQTLQMVISHEMGHLFGLMAHSRRCVDVMSYYHDGKGQKCTVRDESAMQGVAEYRSVLPTACDIERCRAANAAPGGAR